MAVRLWWIFFLIILIIQVTVEDVSVEGYKGSHVLLPCTHQGPDTILSDNVKIYWRYEESVIVYNFRGGQHDLAKQDLRFQNRTHLSPEPQKGNFSLSLTSLVERDQGKYSCFVSYENQDSDTQHVHLRIKEKPTTEPKTDPGSSSMKNSPQKMIILVVLLRHLTSLS